MSHQAILVLCTSEINFRAEVWDHIFEVPSKKAVEKATEIINAPSTKMKSEEKRMALRTIPSGNIDTISSLGIEIGVEYITPFHAILDNWRLISAPVKIKDKMGEICYNWFFEKMVEI